MDSINYAAAIEALLFSSGEPVPLTRLAETLEIGTSACRQEVELLQQAYRNENRGIMIVQLNDRFQLCTKPEFASLVRRILEIRRDMPLSPAAMETLAVIAYNEPVTRSFIEQVRGVDSSQIVNSLVEKGLIQEAGRLEVPGRPISYRTTDNFLRCFGLSSLEELPQMEETGEQLELQINNPEPLETEE